MTTPTQFMKGVGPHRAALLEKLGLRMARDVLFYFPRGYQDLTELRPIDRLEPDLLVSVVGRVEEVELRGSSNGKSILGVLIRDTSRGLRLLWFNQPFLREKFQRGQRVVASGKARQRGLIWEMTHPKVEWLDDEDEETPSGRILPIYSLCEGLSLSQMRRVAAGAVDQYAGLLEDVFPDEYRQQHRLCDLATAIRQIHFPDSQDALGQARRRLAYQELLVLQLAFALRQYRRRQRAVAPSLEATARIDARIRRLIPFPLTAAQNQALGQITHDLARTVPMQRLLLGDVGSGKTILALYAMLVAVAHGHQAVLMAPTEILARQHARTLDGLLSASRVRYGLLTGGLRGADRAELLAQLSAGELGVLIGTHAVLEHDVKFAKLGLVVIDEQQKFGVQDRASLKQAGLDPHYLVMTATPIPRTVALTLYGDLEQSVLNELPPGRQKVHTYHAAAEQRTRWWEFFRRKIDEGRQGYVVTPLVEESERLPGGSVDEVFERLTAQELRGLRLGRVHGRLSSAEKEEQIRQFREGETQVLVCTTVIEVGVDVPNATVMTIEQGERFGLSQLHQLRGRVSRGQHAGFCCVFADVSQTEARERIEAFTKTQDGFRLAEIDLRQRGPGDLFGSRQSGLPPLRIADLERDRELLEEARRDAQELIARDPELALPEHQRLLRMVAVRYGKVLELGEVG